MTVYKLLALYSVLCISFTNNFLKTDVKDLEKCHDEERLDGLKIPVIVGKMFCLVTVFIVALN